MTIKGSLDPGSSLEVSTYAELLYFKRNDTYSVTPTREFRLKVYRHKHLIYRSNLIQWTMNGLNQAIALVDLSFPSHPAGLVYVISVYEIVQGRGVRSEMNVGKYLNANFGKKKRKTSISGGSVKVHLTVNPLILQAVSKAAQAASWSFSRKRELPVKSKRPLSVVKQTAVYPVTQSVAYQVHQYSGFNPVGTTANASYPSYFLTRDSVRTPGFKTASRNGTLPLNPFSMLMQRAEGGALSIHKVSGPDFGHTDSNAMSYSGLSDIPTDHLVMDENRTIAKLASRINATSSNIPEDIVQAKQTIRLFTSKVTQLRAFGRLAHGGSLSSVLKDLGAPGSKQAYKTYNSLTRNGIYGARALSQMWLELRYGWMPLVSDIEGSIKVFSQYVTRNRGLTSVSARNRRIEDFEVPITGITSDGSQNGTKYTHTVTDLRMKIWYQLDSPVVNAFAQLGFTSPIALVWELIPFSFVVDWFLPIGNALNMLNAFDGLSFHKGFKTYFTRQLCTVSLIGGTEPGYDSVSINGMAFLEGVRVGRTVLHDFPSPNLPRLKNPVSTIHAANAVALLVQAFTSGSKKIPNFL